MASVEASSTIPGEDFSRVSLTEESVALLRRLWEQHGPLMFHQSGGCCDGSAPMCYPDGDFLLDRHPGASQLLFQRFNPERRVRCCPDVRTLSEHLHLQHAVDPAEILGGPTMIGRDHLEHRPFECCSERRGRIEREQPTFMQERHTGAALRFVEIGRRHQNRDALREELGQQLPELTP